ncbi:tetratricopeptide repeat protein [Desertivirga brevis]|uniref:tetratricopeptide repeat protein n=1 Tax=Desertivirga brevis TaxID=2810310 RepID=UPI001A979E6F|nr:hypothetical protein [Pedobacter sp. SYSU D00873]
MNLKIIILLLLVFSLTANAQKKMEHTFFTWTAFTANFGKEMASAEDVFNNMVKSGLKDNCLTQLDFTFISDKKKNLILLGDFIKVHYPYKVKEVKKYGHLWELDGETNEIPITADNLLYWALDLYKRGYEFDSRLDAYGGPFDPKEQKFPELDKSKEEIYFDKAVECYNKGDISGALIHWNLALAINPSNPDSYYSRAIVKENLYTWKSALKDYDRAIEIAPDFASALINRGGLKDENQDYKGAIEDYDKVLALDKVNLEIKQMAIFNRGNTKLNLKDKNGACEDWKKAYDLGAKHAKERIDQHCR